MLGRARKPFQGFQVGRGADAHLADQPHHPGRVAVVLDDALALLPLAPALVGAEPAPAGRQLAMAPRALRALDGIWRYPGADVVVVVVVAALCPGAAIVCVRRLAHRCRRPGWSGSR